MNQAITIRRIEASDVEVVTGIYAEVLEPSYISFSELGEGKAATPERLDDRAADIFRTQLLSLLSSARHGFFVAQVGVETVGFTLASLHETEAGHVECWLDDIGVSRNWQRRGIARVLAEKVFDWGADGGAKYFLLESGVRNAGAHHLFASLGFEPLATVFWRDAQRSQGDTSTEFRR